MSSRNRPHVSVMMRTTLTLTAVLTAVLTALTVVFTVAASPTDIAAAREAPTAGRVTASAAGAQQAVAATRWTWGLYSGPGAKAADGARAFTADSRIPIRYVLDFLPGETWHSLTQADWLFDAHRRSGYRLELSVPMLPERGAADLSSCAAGAYNPHWRTIARKLAAAGLGSSAIRPGWEFNGSWYRWSAVGRADAYAGCFRQVVTSMRRVAPSLTFVWCVNGGDGPLDATRAYPGDAYVDHIGVDVYNYDHRRYAAPVVAESPTARAVNWNHILRGPRGLQFWSAYAREHHKPLNVSEWALSWRSDGRAGGDDIVFVDGMAGFLGDPVNGIGWATYFNNRDTPAVRHNIAHPTSTAFSSARVRLLEAAH